MAVWMKVSSTKSGQGHFKVLIAKIDKLVELFGRYFNLCHCCSKTCTLPLVYIFDCVCVHCANKKDVVSDSEAVDILPTKKYC